MSDPTTSNNPGQVDLSGLRLMPDWVASIGKEAPKQKFREYEEREDRGAGRRDDRRGGGVGGRPGDRDGGRGGKFGGGGGPGGERRDRDRGGFGGKGKGKGGPREDRRGPRQSEPQREPIPTDITATIEVEEKAADALAAHIKHTGRAFSMFDASRLVLDSGDRFHVRFACAAERPAGMFRVVADGALFLSREDASRYILNSGALGEYYRTEEIELEEPKGEFKSIGVCGFSGALLGPPSHHSYQPAIVRLHREKFANLSLEDFKRRIRLESDPELVVKWKEQQRKGMRWVYLKGQVAEGAEPLTLATRAEMESHFRRTHLEDSITEVRDAVVPGTGSREKLARVLIILLQRAVENARNHLFEFSQHLGHVLEHRGLKLFKRRSGKLFVSRIRPKAIDPGVVFSERVTAIVETVKERPGILLSKLIEALAPALEATAAQAAEPVAENAEAAETTAASASASSEAPKALTDGQIAVIKDLRWLADEGYVIEYSDGPVFLGIQSEAATPKPKAEKKERPQKNRDKTSGPAAAAPVETSTEESAGAAELDPSLTSPASADVEEAAGSESQFARTHPETDTADSTGSAKESVGVTDDGPTDEAEAILDELTPPTDEAASNTAGAVNAPEAHQADSAPDAAESSTEKPAE